MEIIQSAERGGLVYLTPITSGSTYAVDLTPFIGRYVKICVDQRAYVGWRAVGESTDFTLTASAPSLSVITPDPINPGDQGNQRYVTPSNPVLLVRARSTSVTELIVHVTSGKVDL